MVGAQAVALGHADVVVAGGMENMSQAPYLLRHARMRGYHYGHGVLEDSAVNDGLWDGFNACHMGTLADRTAKKMGISREEQDEYTIHSYTRAAAAWQRGVMDKEVIPINADGSKSQPGSGKSKPNVISFDEEYSKLRMDIVTSLPPIFEDSGTITAGNSSSLNDGAAVVVLISAERAQEFGITGLARIVSFADHAVEPADFALAPSGAIKDAHRAAGRPAIDFYEIHEAFAAVALANMRLLDTCFAY